MAIIDPEGLYSGDRLRKCSDAARLFWPYFFLAANGLGRLEINYKLLVNRIFPDFKTPPTEDELYGFIKEYREAHLIFLYEARGQVWGQWWFKEGCLPRWKTTKDRNSPEPPKAEYEKWLLAYVSDSKPLPKNSEVFRNLTKSFESLPRGLGVGVGVGVGIGEGKEKSPPSRPEPNPSPNFLETDPGYWTERLYGRHPKKKNISLVETWVIDKWLGCKNPIELFREIDRIHALWCKTEDWRKKNGQFAPKLDEWLADRGWSKAPELDDDDEDPEAGNRRYEEQKAAAKRGGEPV